MFLNLNLFRLISSSTRIRIQCEYSSSSGGVFRTYSHHSRTRTFLTRTKTKSEESFITSAACNNSSRSSLLLFPSSSQQKCSRLLNLALINKGSSTHTHQIQQIRCLRTTPRRDALPPFIALIIARVAKVGAMLFGRRVRIWWRNLPPEEREKYAGKARRNRKIIGAILGSLAFGSFIYYESHIQETPFTKRRRFLAFTDAQFNEMAKYELEMMLELYRDKIVPATMNLITYQRVVGVAQRLLRANQDLPQIHDKEWTITVVDEDSQANAFVLPCGSIFVFTGLLRICETDDELGIILGHEMAHAVMGHGAEKASRLHLLDWLMVLPLAALWAIVPTDIAAIIGQFITSTTTTIVMELPHSRFIEHEADQVGLLLAAKACFDVRQCLVLWDKMSLIEGLQHSLEELKLEWLSTHPSHEKRQAQLQELLPDALNLRDKNHCPRLPYYDPKTELLLFEKRLRKNQKPKNEGLLMPVKIK